MKKYFSGHQMKKLICLLVFAGILFIGVFVHEKDIVYATGSSYGTYLGTNLTGDTTERTNINEPGASESQEELQDLNVANTVTINFGEGNGTLNGALRILIILT